jgi:hypothetical protein
MLPVMLDCSTKRNLEQIKHFSKRLIHDMFLFYFDMKEYLSHYWKS